MKTSVRLIAAMLPVIAISCSKPSVQLEAPELSLLSRDGMQFVVGWDEVEGAGSYVYMVNSSGEQVAEGTSIVVYTEEPGTYVVMVKAVPVPGTGMEESSFSRIEVVVEDSRPSLSFSFEVRDLTATSATVLCTPSDLEATYWFDVYLKSDYDNFSSDEEFIESIERELADLGEIEGLTYQEVLEIMLSTGIDEWTPSAMEPDTDYMAYAFGIGTDGTKTSRLFYEVFRTLAAESGAVPAVHSALKKLDAEVF